ncbi:hypothetical protein [Streptomyces sp. AS58]|uniref:hypothetical protein n=1 Tax=Streptomyces sp. AS58 TaxID=1519489 RepID=UPI0006AF7E1E|nr:hypothetical protein [Streptomyces sp. AS58]
MSRRPLLFLDIDGPLNPYATLSGTCPENYTTVYLPPEAHISSAAGTPRAYRRPETVWLNPSHGKTLLTLGFELCWASAWMSDANRWIGPVLGLPPLQFVDFGDKVLCERPDGVHWKSDPLVAYADGRPFAWVDDEQTDSDHTHIATIHPVQALLHHVNPRIGLQQNDFTALTRFAAAVTRTETPS